MINCQNLAYGEDFSFGSPFIDAADKGNLDVMQRMVKAGYNVNTQGAFGTTALMRAAYRGNKNIVEFLLKVGADPDIQDMGGATASHIASREGQHEIIRILMKETSFGELPDLEGYTPSMRAVLSEKPKSLEALVEHGVDLNKSNDQGDTATSLAKKSYNQEIRRIVIPEALSETEVETKLEPQPNNELDLKESIELSNTSELKVAEPVKIELAEEEKTTADLNEPTPDAKTTTIEEGEEAVSFNELTSGTYNTQTVTTTEEKKEVVVINTPENKASFSMKDFFAQAVDPSQGGIEIQMETDGSFDQYIRQKSLHDTSTVSAIQSLNQISVSEPIKLPDDFDAVTYQTLTAVDDKNTKGYFSAMIKGFESESKLNEFWGKLSQNKNMHGFRINLITNKSQTKLSYIIKITYFASRKEVLEACRIVANIDTSLICYSTLE